MGRDYSPQGVTGWGGGLVDAWGRSQLLTIAAATASGEVKAKLLRLEMPTPQCVVVQLSREFQAIGGVIGGRKDLTALVNWSCGAGDHQAEVDIGPGTVFTLAAAQTVEVTAKLTVYGTSSVARTVRVAATAAPADANNPIPAIMTQAVAVPGTVPPAIAATAQSADFVIPQWTRRIWLEGSTPTQIGQAQILLFDGPAGQTVAVGQGPGPIIVPKYASHAAIYCPAANLDVAMLVNEMVL